MSESPRSGHDRSAAVAPRWPVLAAAMVAAGGLLAFPLSPRTALYWYAFPLFGLGGCYLVQFRRQIPAVWRATFTVTAAFSAVALALDWPFSGHVLWNVLFIGHASMTGKQRSPWMALLLLSLLHLIVLKAAFQAPRDTAGAGISVAVAAVVLAGLHRYVSASGPTT